MKRRYKARKRVTVKCKCKKICYQINTDASMRHTVLYTSTVQYLASTSILVYKSLEVTKNIALQ